MTASLSVERTGRIQFRVDVYRDGPEWYKVKWSMTPWFMLPDDVLRRLYVTTYVIDCPDGEECKYQAELLSKVEKIHPGCVYIY
jgi:hypothetical protein